MAEYLQLSDGRPDGFLLGKAASDPWCAHGGTPTTQAATIAAALTTVFTTTPVSGTGWGFASSTGVSGIVNVVNDMRTKLDAAIVALKGKGIIASS